MADYTFVAGLISLGLFIGVLILLNAGRFIGLYRSDGIEDIGKGLGAMEAAVYGLLGLLIAFTFSGAASRYENRRQLIMEESNAIGTAYLRLDLLNSDSRDALKSKFRLFLDTRLEAYEVLPDIQASHKIIDQSNDVLSQIWSDSVSASKTSSFQQAPMLLLPAVNEMIDITTERTAASNIHPPVIIFWMLGCLCLSSALLIGYEMSQRKNHSWLHMLIFTTLLTFIFYVILDLEYPRFGLIRIDAADELLRALRSSMK